MVYASYILKEMNTFKLNPERSNLDKYIELYSKINKNQVINMGDSQMDAMLTNILNAKEFVPRKFKRDVPPRMQQNDDISINALVFKPEST